LVGNSLAEDTLAEDNLVEETPVEETPAKKPQRRNASWKEDRFVKLSHHW